MKDEIKEILNNQKLINVENDYERIIFEYLANNCSEFDDEHIKQLVNLKVEQYKQSLDYITNLEEENEKLKSYIKLTDEEAKKYMYDTNKEIDRLNNIIKETLEIYENRNTCKYKKERFMKDKSTSDLMYEKLKEGK